ncbi:MAG: DNA-binding protein Alba [Candidatus Aenigmarchaeota archaeon]|nr:DNA-binding protein Alba [Candidatus Aenigmarchaeota archaeon]
MAAKKTEEVKEVKEVKGSKRLADNVVFVGRKPTMSYVLAVITQFTEGLKEVHIKARGRSISRAVDVAEIVRNRFLGDAKVNSINIGTEEREVEEGNKINVSTIDIKLVK